MGTFNPWSGMSLLQLLHKSTHRKWMVLDGGREDGVVDRADTQPEGILHCTALSDLSVHRLPYRTLRFFYYPPNINRMEGSRREGEEMG